MSTATSSTGGFGLGRRYGSTDPAEYQLRDIKRRLTSAEKTLERQNARIRSMNFAIMDLQVVIKLFQKQSDKI